MDPSEKGPEYHAFQGCSYIQEYYRGVLVSERVLGNNEEWILNSMTNIMLRIIIAYLHIDSVTPMIILTLQLQL